jgi:hypothetical protein
MTDILKTMADEIAEAVEIILRPHYPRENKTDLRRRAEAMRAKRYLRGDWPSSAELAKQASKEFEQVWSEAHAENEIRDAAKAA